MRGFWALLRWMMERQRRLGVALFVLCLLAWALAAGAGAAARQTDGAPVLTILLTGESEEAQDEARQLFGNQRAQGIDKDHTAHGIQKRRHIQVGQVEKIDHRQIKREKHSLRQGQTVVFSQPLAAS